MIFKWFDCSEVNVFGETLVQLVCERVTPDHANESRTMLKKHEAMLNQLIQQISKFKSNHKLNIYKKAKLGSTFKFGLLEKNYNKEYVDQLTKWLLLNL